MNTAQAANKFTIMLAVAACALVLSFILPWITASFGGYASYSISWVDYITTAGSPWAQDIQSLLIVLGAFAALACAFLVVIQGRRTPALLGLSLLSFAAATIGALWLILQFNQTFGLSSSSGVSMGLGLWIYLVFALLGAYVSFHLLNPAGDPILAALRSASVSSPHPVTNTADGTAIPPTAAPGYPATPGYPTYPNWPNSAPTPNQPAASVPTPLPASDVPSWAYQPVSAAAPAAAAMSPAPPAWSVPLAPMAPAPIPSTPPAESTAATNQKICPNCAGVVAASARFCQFCGSDVSQSA